MEMNENLKIKGRTLNQNKLQVNIKISKQLSDWLDKHNLSPTAVFHEACAELGFKQKAEVPKKVTRKEPEVY